jgi:hypothetical protein
VDEELSIWEQEAPSRPATDERDDSQSSTRSSTAKPVSRVAPARGEGKKSSGTKMPGPEVRRPAEARGHSGVCLPGSAHRSPGSALRPPGSALRPPGSALRPPPQLNPVSKRVCLFCPKGEGRSRSAAARSHAEELRRTPAHARSPARPSRCGMGESWRGVAGQSFCGKHPGLRIGLIVPPLLQSAQYQEHAKAAMVTGFRIT